MSERTCYQCGVAIAASDPFCLWPVSTGPVGPMGIVCSECGYKACKKGWIATEEKLAASRKGCEELLKDVDYLNGKLAEARARIKELEDSIVRSQRRRASLVSESRGDQAMTGERDGIEEQYQKRLIAHNKEVDEMSGPVFYLKIKADNLARENAALRRLCGEAAEELHGRRFVAEFAAKLRAAAAGETIEDEECQSK